MADKPSAAKRLAAQIKQDGGSDAFRRKCEPALKAQPKPGMERRPQS